MKGKCGNEESKWRKKIRESILYKSTETVGIGIETILLETWTTSELIEANMGKRRSRKFCFGRK